jgi:hypothetical protein
MRRVLAGSAAALVMTVGPLGVLWAASPAGASPSAPAAQAGRAAAAPLGGYTLSATGDGMRVTYEQPNLPLPADPSAELDVGYSAATFGSGPVGQSTASVLYPGQVVAASGSQLGSIVPGAPALPDWPVQAHASFPTGAGSAKDDEGPMTMEAGSAAAGSAAKAGMGAPTVAAVPAGLVTAQAVGSAAHTALPAGVATATASASVHDLKIAGGVVEIASAESSATEQSDGRRATCAASSAVEGVTVAGDPVTVDGSGVQAAGHDAPIGFAGLAPQQILQMAGISMKVTAASHSTQGAAGTCAAPSLEVQIDLTKFDADADQLVLSLPSELAMVVYQLPLPVPDSQVVTLDLGSVSVQAAASPAYVPPAFPPPGHTGGASPPARQPVPPVSTVAPAPVTTVTVPATSPVVSSVGPTAQASSATSGLSAAGAPPHDALPAPYVAPVPAATGATVPTAFKGLGAPLVGLGLLGATGVALAVTRLDRRVLAGARRMVCAARPGAAAAGTAAAAGAPWAIGRGNPAGAAPPASPAGASKKGARF